MEMPQPCNSSSSNATGWEAEVQQRPEDIQRVQHSYANSTVAGWTTGCSQAQSGSACRRCFSALPLPCVNAPAHTHRLQHDKLTLLVASTPVSALSSSRLLGSAFVNGAQQPLDSTAARLQHQDQETACAVALRWWRCVTAISQPLQLNLSWLHSWVVISLHAAVLRGQCSVSSLEAPCDLGQLRAPAAASCLLGLTLLLHALSCVPLAVCMLSAVFWTLTVAGMFVYVPTAAPAGQHRVCGGRPSSDVAQSSMVVVG